MNSILLRTVKQVPCSTLKQDPTTDHFGVRVSQVLVFLFTGQREYSITSKQYNEILPIQNSYETQ